MRSMVFDIPARTIAVDDEGRQAIFLDGEDNVLVAAFDARSGIIEFCLYGMTYFIEQSALKPFVAGGVNGR